MARRSSSSNRAESRSSSGSRSGAMTPQEAGRLGGQAPHKCRGFECQKAGSRSRSSSR